jgi:hypothetical protein
MSLTVVPGCWDRAHALIATVAFSPAAGQAFVGMLPILLGAIVGYVLTLVRPTRSAGTSPMPFRPAASPGPTRRADGRHAVFSISIMASPPFGSTAHLYQMSLYATVSPRSSPAIHLDPHVGQPDPRRHRRRAHNLSARLPAPTTANNS